MSGSVMARAADESGAVGDGSPGVLRMCTHCRVDKQVFEFRWLPKANRLHSWCKRCVRVAVAEYSHTDAARAWRKANRLRPEVLAKEKAYGQSPVAVAARRVRLKTTRARLLAGRRGAMMRARRASTPASQAKSLAVAAAYTAELERLRRKEDR